jgi:protein subunit release factor A
MPMPEPQKIHLVTKKDLDISYYIGSGKGGQKKQKTASGVQIIHRESGAIGRASDTRSQDQNKRAAFERMAEHPKFKVWLNRKLYELEKKETIERTIERETAPEFIAIQVKNDEGQWIEVSESDLLP